MMVKQNGKNVGMQKVSLEFLQQRLQFLRQIASRINEERNAIRYRNEEERRSTQEMIKRMKAQATSASSSSRSGDGFSDEELRARSDRQRHEQELADIRARRLEERLEREKAFLKQMDAVRS